LLLGVLFDFVCFFLVFFLTAIGAVYHRPIVPTAKTPMAAPLPHASAQARLIFDTQMLQRSDIAVVADEFDGSPDVWSAIGRNRGTQLPGR
jgi:hypothetical protein